MKNRKILLYKLLQMLVDEWGYEQVAAELARTEQQSLGALRLDKRRLTPALKDKRTLTPSEQVEKALVDPSRKHLLLQLAHRYEQKQFLPSVAAVTEFLTMTGADPGHIKDRIQAFRALLKVLLQLSAERLNQLTNSSLHAGPSQLGPISEAMATVGERLPRRSQDSSNDGALADKAHGADDKSEVDATNVQALSSLRR